jgi:hypothetical protein
MMMMGSEWSMRLRMARRTREAWRASAEVVLRADQMAEALRRVAMRLSLSLELDDGEQE